MADAQELAELYCQVVRDGLGLSPDKTDDGHIVIFEYPQLGTLFFSLDLKDIEVVKLVHPDLFKAPTSMSRETILGICNAVNISSKVPWLMLDEEDETVAASVGMIMASRGMVPDEALLKSVVEQAVMSIYFAVQMFFEMLDSYNHAAIANLKEALLELGDESPYEAKQEICQTLTRRLSGRRERIRGVSYGVSSNTLTLSAGSNDKHYFVYLVEFSSSSPISDQEGEERFPEKKLIQMEVTVLQIVALDDKETFCIRCSSELPA